MLLSPYLFIHLQIPQKALQAVQEKVCVTQTFQQISLGSLGAWRQAASPWRIVQREAPAWDAATWVILGDNAADFLR